MTNGGSQMKKKLLIAVMLLSVLVLEISPENAFAAIKKYNVTSRSSTVTEFETNDLSNSPYNAKFRINGNVISADIYGAGLSDEARAKMIISDSNEYVSTANFSSGVCNLSYDFSGAEAAVNNGGLKYSITDLAYPSLDSERANSGYLLSLYSTKLNIQTENGNSFFNFPAGQSELDFYEKLYKYDPTDYDGIPKSCIDLKNLDKIIYTAERITGNCTNDADKVKRIHDYLAKSIAYDYDRKTHSD